MKTTTFFGGLVTFTTYVSAMFYTPMPRQAAEATDIATKTLQPDPWQCVTKNVSQYFDVPKPTPVLRSALDSYAIKLLEPCRSTAVGPDILSCTLSEKSQYCGFSTAAPASVTAAYESYASAAASWWAAKSSAANSVSSQCPVTWAWIGALDHAWLNQTIAYAECYNDAHPGDIVTASSAPTGSAATPGRAGIAARNPLPTVSS